MKRKNTMKRNANCYVDYDKTIIQIDKWSGNQIKTVFNSSLCLCGCWPKNKSFLKDNHKIKGNSNNS